VRITQLGQIALATDDVEGLREFYRLIGGVAEPPFLDFCGVRLELLERPHHGLVYLSFALGTADAVDELSGVIAAAGYRVLEPPRRTCEVGCYESVVLDPAGNRLKLTV
jgi:hypothetical protein